MSASTICRAVQKKKKECRVWSKKTPCAHYQIERVRRNFDSVTKEPYQIYFSKYMNVENDQISTKKCQIQYNQYVKI